MGVCMYCAFEGACNHRNDGPNQCLWPVSMKRPKIGHLFKLNKNVSVSVERNKERKRVMDFLGVRGTSSKGFAGSPEMAELREALLKTKLNNQGNQVYERDIFFCACYVNHEDIIPGK